MEFKKNVVYVQFSESDNMMEFRSGRMVQLHRRESFQVEFSSSDSSIYGFLLKYIQDSRFSEVNCCSEQVMVEIY